jgi:hypothetical protein
VETVLAELDRTPILALKVAEAFQRHALDFPTPEALRKYLHDHPNADKAKHHIVEKERSHPRKDEGVETENDGHGGHGGHDEDVDEQVPSLKERLKGWTSSALSFMKKAPPAAKKFVTDDDFRRKTLLDAHKELTTAPEKLVKNAIATVKEEVHEWKTAAEGVKTLITGGTLTKHHKQAMKTVGFHISLTLAAAALTASGPLAGAATFVKSMVKHIAMKSTARALGHLHVLEEMAHVGHGVAHGASHLVTEIMSKIAADSEGKKVDPEDLLGHFFAAAVAKEIKELDLDGIGEALKEGGGDDEKK